MSMMDGVRIRFDHVSIAAESIDKGVDFFRRYFAIYPRHEKQISEQASGGFLWEDFFLGSAVVEFIEELPGKSGFISEFIRRHGEGMHHLSFEVDRLEPVVAALKRDGVRIVDEYTLADGNRTAFISPRFAFGTLIQFWQPLDYDNPSPPPAEDGSARFDHVALAVRDIRRAMDFFVRYLGATIVNEPILSSSQGNFLLGHIDIAGFKVEFMQSPGPGTHDDFVARFIERYGEGLHHFTIDVKEFDAVLGKLRADGVRIVGRETNWRGERQFFISPQSSFGTLIQVWDGLSGPGEGSE
ncbi:MAG TPA: VOC family protein [Candidatus Binataceae bacterium]|nr:VOC family protein [Candidatus Binataceae bacterium]